MLTGNVNAQLVVQMYKTGREENNIKYKRMAQRDVKLCSEEQPDIMVWPKSKVVM